MRLPYNNNYSENERLYEFPYFKDDEKSILTPLVFCQNNIDYLEYYPYFNQRYHKTYTNLVDKFLSNSGTMEIFKIKNKSYLSGCGNIFRYTINEDTTLNYFPIIITCFDEQSTIEDYNMKKLTFVVNINELNNPDNKSMKPKLIKLMEQYTKNNDFNVIYTKDVEKWCFSPNPKLKFKSIKEQNEFLDKLVEETV